MFAQGHNSSGLELSESMVLEMYAGLGMVPAACFSGKGKDKHIWGLFCSRSLTPARNKPTEVTGIALVHSYCFVDPLLGK